MAAVRQQALPPSEAGCIGYSDPEPAGCSSCQIAEYTHQGTTMIQSTKDAFAATDEVRVGFNGRAPS